MGNRRKFIRNSIFGGALLGALPSLSAFGKKSPISQEPGAPIVISTWDFGKAANEAAWNVIAQDGSALDAVEQGVKVPEGDPTISSVGYGGTPDREGRVTLDSCIMNEKGDCGSVAFLENIKHPVTAARLVMEKSPHVMLVGEGAQQFALAQGMPKENLLTETARKAWQAWLKKSEYKPIINIENHDTIGMLALDGKGNLSGACTTSGLGYKMRGRVGDSPIIGAGLFVDNEIGAATATGLGEGIIRTAGSHTVVELMRQGNSPEEACRLAVERAVKKHPDTYRDFQIGYIAINKQGQHGGYAIHKGFTYAVKTADSLIQVKAKSWVK